LLSVFLSIHVGVLMDRFGTRRVSLFFVWMAMALAPVFPLLPWFWPLLLQIINGGALQFAWSGSQTLIAHRRRGGRISRCMRSARGCDLGLDLIEFRDPRGQWERTP